MHRRDFLTLGGIGLGGLLVPAYFGKAIAAEQLLSTLDLDLKKSLADTALAAATGQRSMRLRAALLRIGLPAYQAFLKHKT